MGILAGMVLAMALVFMAAGKIYINDVPMDFMFELDTAWRLHTGQVPYIDFITPIGPVFYIVSGWAHRIFGPGPMTQAWLPMIPSLLLGAMMLWVGRRRLPPRMALLLAVLMVVRTCSPRFIDYVFLESSFLAPYNTFSSFLAVIVMLASALPVRGYARKSWHPWMEGAILGFCLTCMVFLKMHYAVICAVVMLGCALVRPNARVSLIGAIGACLLLSS
ncbi:MAG: hypothetical protein ACRYGG_00570, partial [Janthinobacterium lividum]